MKKTTTHKVKEMKSWILFFVISLTGLSSQAASSSNHELYKAPVTKANFQNHSALAKDQLHGGSIALNLSTDKAQLELFLRPHCPSGMFCAAVMKEWKVALPLRSSYTNACGVKVFKASTLLGSLSTTYQELIIKDYTSSNCAFEQKPLATRIEYRQIDFSPSTSNSIEQRSIFEAQELRLTF